MEKATKIIIGIALAAVGIGVIAEHEAKAASMPGGNKTPPQQDPGGGTIPVVPSDQPHSGGTIFTGPDGDTVNVVLTDAEQKLKDWTADPNSQNQVEPPGSGNFGEEQEGPFTDPGFGVAGLNPFRRQRMTVNGVRNPFRA